MKKWFLKPLIAVVMVVCMTFVLVGCGGGANGKSAYEIAVGEGFNGTVQEWLDSLKGADGTNGKDGANGTDGINGQDGEDGLNGADGQDGAQGEKGEKGDTGTQGEKGDNGADGIDGKDGAKGEKGDKGDQGEKGDTGAQGENGTDGQDGKDGTNGTNGTDGLSAFEQWALNERNAGKTESDFYIWLENGGVYADEVLQSVKLFTMADDEMIVADFQFAKAFEFDADGDNDLTVRFYRANGETVGGAAYVKNRAWSGYINQTNAGHTASVRLYGPSGAPNEVDPEGTNDGLILSAGKFYSTSVNSLSARGYALHPFDKVLVDITVRLGTDTHTTTAAYVVFGTEADAAAIVDETDIGKAYRKAVEDEYNAHFFPEYFNEKFNAIYEPLVTEEVNARVVAASHAEYARRYDVLSAYQTADTVEAQEFMNAYAASDFTDFGKFIEWMLTNNASTNAYYFDRAAYETSVRGGIELAVRVEFASTKYPQIYNNLMNTPEVKEAAAQYRANAIDAVSETPAARAYFDAINALLDTLL